MAGLISFRFHQLNRADLYVLSSRKQDNSFTALTMHSGSAKPPWIKALVYPSAHERDPILQPLYEKYGGTAVRLWLMMLTEPGVLYCTNPSTLAVFLEEVYTSWSQTKTILLDWATDNLPQADWKSFTTRLGHKRSKRQIQALATQQSAPDFSEFLSKPNV